MSPRASRFLAEALERSPLRGEDRVTEILAHVLQHDLGALNAFSKLLGLGEFAEMTVSTQHLLIGGRRVDLALQLSGSASSHVLWVEVKIDALEQQNQLFDYARELARLYPMRSTLVALAPRGHDLLIRANEQHDFGDGQGDRPLALAVTWQEVANRFEHEGRRRGHGLHWRSSALGETAEARQRTLLEFLSYLERRGLSMTDDPLTLTDAIVASRAEQLLDDRGGAIMRLLDRAASEVEGPSGGTPTQWSWPGKGMCTGMGYSWPLDASIWPARLNPGGVTAAGLCFVTTDQRDRPREPRDQAVFLATLEFEPAAPTAVAALSDPHWLLPEHVSVNIKDRKAARVSTIRYLSEVATSGITLSEQATALAGWATVSFAELLALPLPAGT